MMNGAKKSDSLIIPAKPANKAPPPLRSRWREAAGPREMRNCKARSERRAGKPCHRRRTAYVELSPGREAHSAPAPHHGRRPAESVLQTEEARRSRCRRRDMGG